VCLPKPEYNMTTQHSPLPWRSENGRIYGTLDLADFNRKEEILIADTAPDDSALTEYDEANGQFIATACNSHAALVGALEAFVDHVYGMPLGPDTQKIYEQARAALVLAKGGK